MSVLHVKSPNGTVTNVDLSKLVYDNDYATITGLKTFDKKIDFTYGSIAGFKYDNYGDTSGNEFDQLMIVAQNMGNWDGGGAKIALHSYKEGSATCDGMFHFLASNGTSHADLKGFPDGSLYWAGHPVVTCQTGSNFALFKNGTKFQWGGGATDGDNIGRVTFPVAFTSNAFFVCNAWGDTYTSFTCLIRSLDNNGATVLINNRDNIWCAGIGFNWLAIGY